MKSSYITYLQIVRVWNVGMAKLMNRGPHLSKLFLLMNFMALQVNAIRTGKYYRYPVCVANAYVQYGPVILAAALAHRAHCKIFILFYKTLNYLTFYDTF